jgi:hypothetical protein
MDHLVAAPGQQTPETEGDEGHRRGSPAMGDQRIYRHPPGAEEMVIMAEAVEDRDLRLKPLPVAVSEEMPHHLLGAARTQMVDDMENPTGCDHGLRL